MLNPSIYNTIIVVLIAILAIIAYAVIKGIVQTSDKKKDTSVNLTLFIQEECLITSDAIKDFPIAQQAMEHTITMFSDDEPISTTTETTTLEAAEI